MLHTEGFSALVRLSDAIKSGLLLSVSMTEQIVAAHKKHKDVYDEIRKYGEMAQKQGADVDSIMEKAKAVSKKIPPSDTLHPMDSLFHLHGQSLSVILLSCFCLESYINNIAYFLFKEKDYLGLLKDGHKTSSELIIETINRMSIRDKWQKVCSLKEVGGFDRSRSPFQDFGYLFNFRDDVVHDKVSEFGKDRAKKRYNNRLPDPVLSQLSLKHAQYAATVYWDMVEQLHKLLGIDCKEFQKHYNLSPWRSTEERSRIDSLVSEYSKSDLDVDIRS